MMLSDVLPALAFLQKRMNEREPTTMLDLNIIDDAIKEITRLRSHVAMYEANDYKKKDQPHE